MSGIENAEIQLKPTYTAITGSPAAESAEDVPKPALGADLGGIGAFFDRIMKNPLLLLIAVVILVLIIGRVF